MDAREQIYTRALNDIGSCRRGSERRQVIQQTASALGVSEATVYRNLKVRGWSSGRQQRRDRGASAVSRDQLEQVARLQAKGRNKRGQANVPAKEAVEIAQARGLVPPAMSYSQICRQLRRHGLDGRAMRAPSPGIARVSRHPNHVWFIDVSVAIQWYFRDEKGRKKLGLYSDGDRRFYEGKRQNLVARDRVLLRYMVVDHYTYVRYYYSRGENAVDVVDFMYRAMAPKFDVRAFPMRGIPRRLVVDQGPAFKAALTQNLLAELQIECELHGVGNAKASGAVETRHNHWQRSFEGRLALRPADDLEQINHWAERWCALANAERPHSRPPDIVPLDPHHNGIVEPPPSWPRSRVPDSNWLPEGLIRVMM